MIIENILLGPVVTEKSVTGQEGGVYTFWVHPEATKIDVKNAFLELYGRDVSSVRIVKLPKKVRLVGRGRVMTKRRAKKKAYVQLADGKPLEILDIKTSVK